MKPRWTLVHGWAGSSQDWAAWRSFSPVSRCYNRGYLGDCVEDVWDCSHLITYSMGLHWVPPAIFSQLELLVIISSFLQWPKPAAARKLRRGLSSDVATTLEGFYRSCGYDAGNSCSPSAGLTASACTLATDPKQIDLNSVDLDLLDADLAKLCAPSVDPDVFEQVARVIVLHGTDDAIVPAPYRPQIPDAETLLVQGAGHALPFTHTELCQWELARRLNL